MVDAAGTRTLRRSARPLSERTSSGRGRPWDDPFIPSADVGQELQPLAQKREAHEKAQHRPREVDVLGGTGKRSDTFIADARILDELIRDAAQVMIRMRLGGNDFQ